MLTAGYFCNICLCRNARSAAGRAGGQTFCVEEPQGWGGRCELKAILAHTRVLERTPTRTTLHLA